LVSPPSSTLGWADDYAAWLPSLVREPAAQSNEVFCLAEQPQPPLTADVDPMEELCVVPESQMISILTLRNTTLEPLINLRIDGRPLHGGTKSLWEVRCEPLSLG
jgi:hypothetical protein